MHVKLLLSTNKLGYYQTPDNNSKNKIKVNNIYKNIITQTFIIIQLIFNFNLKLNHKYLSI